MIPQQNHRFLFQEKPNYEWNSPSKKVSELRTGDYSVRITPEPSATRAVKMRKANERYERLFEVLESNKTNKEVMINFIMGIIDQIPNDYDTPFTNQNEAQYFFEIDDAWLPKSLPVAKELFMLWVARGMEMNSFPHTQQAIEYTIAETLRLRESKSDTPIFQDRNVLSLINNETYEGEYLFNDNDIKTPYAETCNNYASIPMYKTMDILTKDDIKILDKLHDNITNGKMVAMSQNRIKGIITQRYKIVITEQILETPPPFTLFTYSHGNQNTFRIFEAQYRQNDYAIYLSYKDIEQIITYRNHKFKDWYAKHPGEGDIFSFMSCYSNSIAVKQGTSQSKENHTTILTSSEVNEKGFSGVHNDGTNYHNTVLGGVKTPTLGSAMKRDILETGSNSTIITTNKKGERFQID